MMLSRLISKPQLYQFAVHEILNLYIMPYYTVAPNVYDLDIFERIIALIPRDWISTGYSTPTDFKGIESYLFSLIDELSHAPDGTCSRLSSLLVSINSLDKASIVAKYK